MGGKTRTHIHNRFSAIPAHIGAAALLIFLSACATPPERAGDAAGQDRDAGESAATDNRSDAIPVVQTPQENVSTDALAPKTAARVVHADELVGKKGAEITDLLGKPSLIRRDRQAQVWQYRGQSCVLDLFFYPPSGKTDAEAEQTGERAVVYFETRGKDAEQVSVDRCLSEVVSARAGAG